MSHQAWIYVALPTPYSAQLDQILSSAETLLASTCDDGTTQIVLFIEPIEHLTHLLMSRKGDAVHLLLAVDGDKEDIVGRVREEDMGCGRRRGLWLDGRHIDGGCNSAGYRGCVD